MRALLSNVTATAARPVNINELIGHGAGPRPPFDYITLVDSGLLTHDEVDNLRPRAYAALARDRFERDGKRADAPPVRFVKVHDAYVLNSAGQPLLAGSQAASGAIVIVRDPRDIAVSFASYANASIDESIARINDEGAALAEKEDRQHPHVRTRLRDWSGHVSSWLDQSDIPVHLIRYEDLQKNTFAALDGAVSFAGLKLTKKEIEQAIQFSDFTLLQQQEQQNGFIEAPPRAKFFRRGKVGNWRDELGREQVARIESRHHRMMRRLGYELSFAHRLANAV